MVLCSAPWYWNTRRISLDREIAQMYSTIKPMRSIPSITTNAIDESERSL